MHFSFDVLASRSRKSHILVWFVLALALCLPTARVAAQITVLTQHNDIARTGANVREAVLNTSNVNVAKFGKLFVRPLDGDVYAQPLYVPRVRVVTKGVDKGLHNVVFVATTHNTIYAYDADDSAQTTPLWTRNLGPSVPASLLKTPYSQKEIGITSTPVITVSTDPATQSAIGTIYLVVKTLENNVQIYRLHALDITSGVPVAGTPIVISGSVPGTGDGGTTDTFVAARQLNRAALLMLGNVVYIAFGAQDSNLLYHGWVFGYNTTNLKAAPLIFNTTPDGMGGGIWQGGQGLAADTSGSFYAMTGSGSSDAVNGGSGFSEAFLKLTPKAGKLSVTDWFIPFDYDTLNTTDMELGSGGPMGIPGTHLIVGGGKAGKLYLVNTLNMGHFHAGQDSQIAQNFQAYVGEQRGGFVFWNGNAAGPQLYVWGGADYGRAFSLLSSNLFQTSPVSTTNIAVTPGPSNSPALAISANGGSVGSGILWAAMPSSGDASQQLVPGVLRAFDAANLSVQLWSSDQLPNRDGVGNWAKFCPPTIVNGKVYMASNSRRLSVYGLLPAVQAGTGTVIGVDFTGGGPNGNPRGLNTVEGAGVVSRVNWNSTSPNAVGSLSPLKDNSGGATTAAVSWTSDNIYSLPIVETDGNARMMKGYLDTGNGVYATQITVSNVPTAFQQNGYDVYVYCDGDNQGSDRTGYYSIGNTTLKLIDPANTDFNGKFVRAFNGPGNYLVFPNLKGASFTLKATAAGGADSVERAPVNGFQIVSH